MAALEPGMIVSNEPGYYREGHYGIRLENLLAVTEAKAVAGGELPVIGFETLTLAPFDRRLIVPDLLSPGEREWLNAYHARVWREISPTLNGSERRWLKEAAAPM
jgi:Xaa-Pro aminopeptidase